MCLFLYGSVVPSEEGMSGKFPFDEKRSLRRGVGKRLPLTNI